MKVALENKRERERTTITETIFYVGKTIRISKKSFVFMFDNLF